MPGRARSAIQLGHQKGLATRSALAVVCALILSNSGCSPRLLTPGGASGAAVLSDSVAPAPGGGGTITALAATSNKISLGFTKGTDNSTSAANLQYKAYTSNSNNLTSAAATVANGVQNGATQTDVAAINLTGLAASTTYYYNVLVVDSAGNAGSYASGNTTTTAVDMTPPSITTFTSDKVRTNRDDKTWNLAFTYTDDERATGLWVEIYYSQTATPKLATRGGTLLTSGYDLTSASSLTGPANTNTFINYLLVVSDGDNETERHLTVYSQNAVSIASVARNVGPIATQNFITIMGDGFTPTSIVTISPGYGCTTTYYYTSKVLGCLTNSIAAVASYDIIVTNSDGSSATSAAAYSTCSGAGCTHICDNPGSWGGTFAAGDGLSAGTAYQICNGAHLDAIRTLGQGFYYELKNNIDLSGYAANSFAPITDSGGTIWQGYFNGNNHSVRDWTYTNAVSYIGLFRRLDNAPVSTIQNLAVVGATLNAGANGYVGTVFADGNSAASHTLSNLHGQGALTGTANIGGISGNLYEGINGCSTNVTITANGMYVGGVAGYFSTTNNALQSCTTEGSISNAITASDNDTGGIAGSASGNDGFNNLWSFMTINGSKRNLGGAIGHSYITGTSDGIYTFGNVTAAAGNTARNIGGAIGYLEAVGTDVFIDNLHAFGDVSTDSMSLGGAIGAVQDNGGGTAKTPVRIRYSSAHGTVTSAETQVGGFAGYWSASFYGVSESFALGNVTSTYSALNTVYVGGFFGRTAATTYATAWVPSTFSKLFAQGHVASKGHMGGFVGYAQSGNFSECGSIGNVTVNALGGLYVGGFVGDFAKYRALSVANSYSLGNISGSNANMTAGFAGYYAVDADAFNKNYSAGKVSGTGATVKSFLAGVGGGMTLFPSEALYNSTLATQGDTYGTGKTTTQMKDVTTFTTSGMTYDFVTTPVWEQVNTIVYPHLYFETH